MAKVLMLVAQSGFRDEELLLPKAILENAGHSTKIASATRAKAQGVKGAVVQPDMSFFEANPDFFDCIIVVGGPGSRALAEDHEVLRILADGNAKEKIIGAICLGPLALAAAGIVKDRNITIFPDMPSIHRVRDAGAVYFNKHVLVDNNFITADGPQSSEEFGAAIVEQLAARRPHAK